MLLKYRDEIQNYYTALYEQNMATDIIGVEDDFSGLSREHRPGSYIW